MTNEELTIMANFITEVRELRKNCDDYYQACQNEKAAHEKTKSELLTIKLTANDYRGERKRRLELRSQLNALAETLNALAVDVGKLKHPREFLCDFKAAVEKCIKDNNIVIRNLEDEK